MRLSIVTVCYNSEKCIEKTILSVLNQEMPVYEYIIVDGASKDSSYEIICSYDQAFLSKGIKYHHISEKDQGISDAFNKGITMAKGDLIGLINADDELLPQASSILNKKYNSVNADIYYGNCIWVDEQKQIQYVSKPKHDLKRLLYRMILIHPSTFVKKSAYEECGLFNLSYKYCMDKELLYRMYLKGKKFEYIDENLTLFKAGGVSDSHAKAVFQEESKMALGYGEPKIKVWLIEQYKYYRNELVQKLKSTLIFKKIKKTEKIERHI